MNVLVEVLAAFAALTVVTVVGVRMMSAWMDGDIDASLKYQRGHTDAYWSFGRWRKAAYDYGYDRRVKLRERADHARRNQSH